MWADALKSFESIDPPAALILVSHSLTKDLLDVANGNNP
jgi:hypothetical protein